MASFRLTTWWQIHGSLSSQEQQAHRTWTPRQSHRHAGSRWNFLIQEKRRHPSRTPIIGHKMAENWNAHFLRPCWVLPSCTWWSPSSWLWSPGPAGSLVGREPRRAQTSMETECLKEAKITWKNVNVFSKMSRWRQNSCVRVRIWHWTQRNWWNNIQYLGIACSA